MNIAALSKLAMQAALAAGQIIQRHWHEEVTVEYKQGGSSYASQVVTQVDKACETAILAHLLPTCEQLGIALLSEETEDDRSRLVADFFWCIDPLDGTLAFIKQQPGFSVSIALVARDGTPYIGVVFDPSTDTLYHAIRGKGAYRNQLPWVLGRPHEHLTYVSDRKLKDTPRAAEIKSLLHEKAAELGLNGVQEMAGLGAVLSAIRVLENGPACMLKLPKKELGGGSVWDYAATACIFQELDLPATNFTGGRLDLNREEDTFMNQQGIFYANL